MTPAPGWPVVDGDKAPHADASPAAFELAVAGVADNPPLLTDLILDATMIDFARATRADAVRALEAVAVRIANPRLAVAVRAITPDALAVAARATPLIRTDFSDDGAWERLVVAVCEPVVFDGEVDAYKPELVPISNPSFAGVDSVTEAALVAAGVRCPLGFALLADYQSIRATSDLTVLLTSTRRTRQAARSAVP